MAPTELKLSDSDPAQNRRSSDTDGLPWPVKAIVVLGATSAIACFLVWFLASTVMSAIGEIKKDTAAIGPHIAASEQLGTTLRQLEEDHRDSNKRIESYMRLMCVQAAKNAQDRHDCLSIQ